MTTFRSTPSAAAAANHASWRERESQTDDDLAQAIPLPLSPSIRDISWIDDNDGRGQVKLSNSIRCF